MVEGFFKSMANIRQSALALAAAAALTGCGDTGANEPWDAKIATKLGADEYLRKFPDADNLSDVLAAFLPEDAAKSLGSETPA